MSAALLSPAADRKRVVVGRLAPAAVMIKSDRGAGPVTEPKLMDRLHHLSMIVGFCDVLLGTCLAGAADHHHLLDIQKAEYAAMSLVPERSKQVR